MKSSLKQFRYNMNIKVRFFHSPSCPNSNSSNSSNSSVRYNNLLDNKERILEDNKEKCEIYKWTNNINNKVYVRSLVNLGYRISSYLSPNYLRKRTSVYKSKIYNALLTYVYDNFCLEILEYCDKSSIIKREQFYIDLIKPEYNILTKAGSSLGFKHSKETLLKFKLRKLSDETLSNLRKARKGAVLSPLAKVNQLISRSHSITVKDMKSDEIKRYSSICAAARQMKVNHATLLNYINKNKLFKDKYLIIKNSSLF